MNRVDNQKHGFTIIELMLAMAFVSALLLAIAMTVIQIGNIYNSGITYKDVNQVGGTISNELQRSIAVSTPFKISDIGSDSKYIKQDFGGRLCTGTYSYIWNYGTALAANIPGRLNIYTADSSNLIRFVKINDSDGSYCTYPSKEIEPISAVELLDAGQHNLAIHSFKISSTESVTDDMTGQQLYNIEFELGTNNTDAITTDSSGYHICKKPTESGSDTLYCSVIRFNLTARAGNKNEVN
jgi:type II secretory pathway pseudopilin PulG